MLRVFLRDMLSILGFTAFCLLILVILIGFHLLTGW